MENVLFLGSNLESSGSAPGFGEWGVETFDPKSNPFEFQVDRLCGNRDSNWCYG